MLEVSFFFQAEDGIRDAQESRGLGDVYKRQGGVRLRRPPRPRRAARVARARGVGHEVPAAGRLRLSLIHI